MSPDNLDATVYTSVLGLTTTGNGCSVARHLKHTASVELFL